MRELRPYSYADETTPVLAERGTVPFLLAAIVSIPLAMLLWLLLACLARFLLW